MERINPAQTKEQKLPDRKTPNDPVVVVFSDDETAQHEEKIHPQEPAPEEAKPVYVAVDFTVKKDDKTSGYAAPAIKDGIAFLPGVH